MKRFLILIIQMILLFSRVEPAVAGEYYDVGHTVLEVAGVTREKGMTDAAKAVAIDDFRVITVHYLGFVIPILLRDGGRDYVFIACSAFSKCYDLPTHPADTSYTYEHSTRLKISQFDATY